MMFERYGFQETPGEQRDLPLQYSPNGRGGWVMNCFTCHGGKVNGEVVPGLPNTHIALQTLVDDVRMTKVAMKRPLAHMELGSLIVPLGTSRGVTNAVIFGVALGSQRDGDLHYRPNVVTPPMRHHDMDAPPWWNVKRKTHLYADGFAPNSHRSMMQFLMVPANGPKQFQAFEEDFKRINDYILSLEPPKYPWSIDKALAQRGEIVFNNNCSECHGTYGPDGSYPNENVALDVVGTDRVRYDSLGPPAYQFYHASWFNKTSRDPVNLTPAGYVAPPLDGIWASAPYLHNGSVPTLYHLMHSAERPVVWKRTEDGYDQKRVGLEVEELDRVPSDVASPVQKRYFYDTTLHSKSAAGHTFPDKLSEDDKSAVIEYLKTL
jgi:mono/diheme cytochrome c family protein